MPYGYLFVIKKYYKWKELGQEQERSQNKRFLNFISYGRWGVRQPD